MFRLDKNAFQFQARWASLCNSINDTAACLTLVSVRLPSLSGPAQQALQTPQTMLEEVVWCVSESPEQARLDSLHPAAAFAHASVLR